MVVCYCPACGREILLKAEDRVVWEFTHCGHHVVITPEKEKKKKSKK